MLNTTLPVLAQCVDNFCPTATWSAVSSFPVSFNVYGDCPGCTGKIYIKIRDCLGSCDIYVEKIELDNASCICDGGKIFKSAIADLFLSNLNLLPIQCRPENGQCVTNWRVILGGCYELIMPQTRPPYYQHCPIGRGLENCCNSQYRICKSPTGVISFTEIGATSIAFECPFPCASYCGYKPKYDPIGSKRALPQDAPEIAETTVIPNPTSGITIIRCTAVTVPEATAEVVDAQGNVVIKKSATTTKEHTLEFEIDAKALTTGSYQYRITSEQQHVAAGSFNVVK
ncbi:MAG: T9SS type A sorting domain-containing protein [Armatimonadetes bacterium]|nr:T9SS type A sorting domain-containing protein [Armatimonadota bacterium]